MLDCKLDGSQLALVRQFNDTILKSPVDDEPTRQKLVFESLVAYSVPDQPEKRIGGRIAEEIGCDPRYIRRDVNHINAAIHAFFTGPAAHSLILMHCHPSGDSNPSDADIKVTRDLIRAGQLLKIEVLDHVIIGAGNFSSLRSLGYFHA